MRRNYLPLAVLFPLAMSSACSKDAPADSAAPYMEPAAQAAPNADSVAPSGAPAEEAEAAPMEAPSAAQDSVAAKADAKALAPPPAPKPVMAEPQPVEPDNDAPRAQAPAQQEGQTPAPVNPMIETAQDRFSTFAIDVDTGAYTLARNQLNSGHMPAPGSVRVEEFVNYFSYNYPAPDDGSPFSVSMEAAPSPWGGPKDRYLMRVGLQGKRISAAERKPVHLTFLVDVSGSMNAPDKLGLAKKALTKLTNNLRGEDTVALVTYAGATKVVLQPTSVAQKAKIIKALDDLTSGGGTSMGSGMSLAYDMALQTYKKGHVNRVIVLSDGDANIGPVSQAEIMATIKSRVDEGITMSAIGLGMGNYRDSMMEQLANQGNGNYYYIDSEREAQKVFGDQLDGTLEVIAKDVKIQVEFDPQAVTSYRLVGYENRDIADKDFRNDRVDAGEIGAGHTVTAMYEIDLNPAHQGTLATVRVRHKAPDGDVASERAFTMTPREVRKRLQEASQDFQFAAAVTAFAEVLRLSPYAEKMSLAMVAEIAQPAIQGKEDRQELLALIQRASSLKR